MFRWDVVANALHSGPYYAICKSQLDNDDALDAEQAWTFWTKPRHRVVRQLADLYPFPPVVRRRLRSITRSRHKGDLLDHYNVSNEFFLLFLDKRYRFYSCANFDSPDDTLELAQHKKAEFVLDLMQLRDGSSVLDLGCGWGGMMTFLQNTHPQLRASVTGVTLSKEQVSYIRSLGVGELMLVDFLAMDTPDPRYDSVVSLGAWEHIPPDQVPLMYQKAYQALTPGGRFVAELACDERQRPAAPLLLTDFFFSGFYLLHLHQHLTAATQAGFSVVHSTVQDYRPTWKEWFDRLAANRERAIALAGLRTYKRYLLLFAIAWKMFDEGYASLWRVAFQKPPR